MSHEFQLRSHYQPSGDQPEAIELLTKGLKRGDRFQTLLGATGTGKTFTVANVIQNIQKPTLVIAHNKTLAAQLCNEFRQFFPENAVEYFVSYYDYYQPEAYIARTDTYIEKEAMINEEIDRLRHSATQALLTRNDVLIVASVSCIYGLGAPETYEQTVLHLKKGDNVTRENVLQRLIEMQFLRTNADLTRGSFRTHGEVLELMPANEQFMYRIEAPGGVVDRIAQIDPVTRKSKREQEDLWVFPAKHFITLGPERDRALKAIRQELQERIMQFEREGKLLEAERLDRRTKFDLEMIENLGYCSGIENYSRHLSGRAAGEPPDTLLSYFPEDFLLVVDESHVTIPQLAGMYEGDRSRKDSLVQYGFRLPSARDNRPLKFKEIDQKIKQAVFVSATPGEFEFKHSAQIVEQIIRPTGLVDPEVAVKPISPSLPEYGGQVDDLIQELQPVLKRHERALITTLTKKMAEDLTNYLSEKKFKVRYLHSDIQTVDRLEILSDFRKGTYDVVVGVNLLREGLDLPEVSLVAILDADKEGFLRSETSLIQTIGRAARNVFGKVILYADVMTGSMKRAIQETNRRRQKQMEYNKIHGITPKTIMKAQEDLREMLGIELKPKDVKEILKLELSAETHDLEAIRKQKEREMKEAALNLEFELAAVLRDEISVLNQEMKKRGRNTSQSPLSGDAEGGGVKIKRPPRHGRTK
ncbi:MAG TPA: excinuclease ABC subunit UvrB [Patescibacteria group bacterium]|nr:excinuclease ABC subunit UvrB [Patescibacteria group bacterium]